MTFEEACRQAASDFLQTIVLVDDRASFDNEVDDVDEIPVIQEPDDLVSAPASDQPIVVAGSRGENLDAGVITKRFADKGLLCSVLKPTAEVSLTEQTLRVAHRADILVLDWEMLDSGEKALTIIGQLIENDRSQGGRLRLVVIYTGVTPLTPISNRIANEIPLLQQVPNSTCLIDQSGQMKVAVLGKGGPVQLPENEKKFGVETEGLPDRLVDEFVQLAGGLLPNVSLASMSHLRDNTHRLLARFNKRLDPALVTHHALLGSPPDSEQYVADLIMEEIEAQIPLGKISAKYAGSKGITEYLRSQHAFGRVPKLTFDLAPGHTEWPVSIEKASEVLENGMTAFDSVMADMIRDTGGSKTALKDELKKPHNRLYCFSGAEYEASVKAHEEFAIVSSVRRTSQEVDLSQFNTFPTLKLGAVVHDGTDYFLCLTPLCDSVRRKGATATFTFVRFAVNDESFSLVVNDGGHKRLVVDKKNPYFRTFTLKTSRAEDIRAQYRVTRTGGDFIFEAALADGKRPRDPDLRWIADMKPMQAQRFVGSLTANISRIGLDEFEWQRLHAPAWN